MRVLTARGGEREHEFSFGVVRQLFEPVLALAPREEREELLVGAAALAAPLFDERALSDPEALADNSFATLHGLFWLAGNLATRQPLLLPGRRPALGRRRVASLAELHRASARGPADPRRRRDAPSAQSNEEALVAEMIGDPGAVVIRPQTLTLHAAASLIRETLARDVDVEFADACHEATGGNPLLLRALLDALDEGIAQQERGARVRDRPRGRLALRQPPAVAAARRGDLARRGGFAVLGDDVLTDAATLAGVDPEARAPRRRSRGTGCCAPSATSHSCASRAGLGLRRAERRRARAQHAAAAALLAEANAPTEQIATCC